MRLHFAEQYVQNVPETPGIFCLWDSQHLVYVGRTAPRSNLHEHFERWGALPRYNESPRGRDEVAILRARGAT